MKCVGFEHLHLHTDFSLLDGYGQAEEYAARWKAWGGNYLCISDHGMMAAVPRQIKACEPSGQKDDPHRDKKLHPIFACELYVNPLQIEVNDEKDWDHYKKSLTQEQLKLLAVKGAHLLAIAYSDVGYRNLVKLTSLAWTKGYYYGRPRLNHEQLQRYKEGILFTSCCYASEVGKAFDRGLAVSQEAAYEAGFQVIEKYMAMFGDKYYLEIMLLDFAKQKPYDAFILKARDRYGLPLIVTNDCHYCNPEDSRYQRLMLMVQTQTTEEELNRKVAMAEEGTADFFELQDKNLWMKTEQELNEKWMSDYRDIIDLELFEQAKLETVKVCEKARGVKLDRSIKLPQIQDADDKLQDFIVRGALARHIPQTKEYTSRLREEYNLIRHKQFSSYFLIQKQMTDEARRISPILLGWGDGSEAVGPGRGSAVGSLVCYCLGITDVDPIKHGLLFKRFLSEARGGKTMKLRFKNIDPLPPEEGDLVMPDHVV
jgi:DNA polymerase-3 subunit alpha